MDRFKLIGISLIFALLMFGFGTFKGYGWGSSAKQAEWDKAKLATVDKKVSVKARQDEIQNAPIDTGVTVRRLRSGTF